MDRPLIRRVSNSPQLAGLSVRMSDARPSFVELEVFELPAWVFEDRIELPARSGTSIVIATQDLEVAQRCDSAGTIRDGRPTG